MKILHIVGSFLNGGIETLLVNVANKQAQNGNKVGIIFITNKVSQELVKQIDSSVCKFYIKKPVGSKNPYYMLKINFYYLKFNPNVLHLHAPNLTSFLFLKKSHEKSFVTLHKNIIRIHYSYSVNQYIAISECVKESFIRQTGKQNCIVCYNGIPIEKFVCKKNYLQVPQKIVCVGRVLFNVKGQDIIVDALSQLKNRGFELFCDFYGNGKDDNNLKDLIETSGLQNTVRVLGDIPNDYIAKHLCEYDLAIQASRHEGLGISAIESMASGVPTILSAVDGFLEVSSNGKYATLFHKESATELCEIIVNAIKNYQLLVHKAEMAKKYIDNTFSISGMVKELNKIYNM